MSVADNLTYLNEHIRSAAAAGGRAASDVRLVAVSKKQPTDKVQAALDAGHRLFGENQVQEATRRWQNIKPHYPDLKLHLIGPLQTNKVKAALRLFDVIETLDREKLALALSKAFQSGHSNRPCFIQVNTGEEEQKSGIVPNHLPEFLKFCRHDCSLDIQGLMCIPPLEEPPALHFALLKKLADRHDLRHLSMGMSGDFETAIQLGATHVRIGTRVFGQRTQI